VRAMIHNLSILLTFVRPKAEHDGWTDMDPPFPTPSGRSRFGCRLRWMLQRCSERQDLTWAAQLAGHGGWPVSHPNHSLGY
jgi:hypothetical protein